MKKDIKTLCLHLELEHNYMLDYEKRMLKRYGESSTGNSISRDIITDCTVNPSILHPALQTGNCDNLHHRRRGRTLFGKRASNRHCCLLAGNSCIGHTGC